MAVTVEGPTSVVAEAVPEVLVQRPVRAVRAEGKGKRSRPLSAANSVANSADSEAGSSAAGSREAGSRGRQTQPPKETRSNQKSNSSASPCTRTRSLVGSSRR